MKHTLFLAASLAALGLAGCNKSEPAADATPTMAATEDAMASPAATEQASAGQTFANTAAASDMFEIETSKLAETKAQSAKVKAFAQQMIKAHTDSTAKLKAAAAGATPVITPMPELSAMQQQTLDSLSSAEGAAFDRAYAEAQVNAHQMTLDALKSYSASGEVASLKTFAGEMVPIVTAHLNMAKAL